MLNNITWYWYLTCYCLALQCIARYCMVFSSISFLLRAIKANKAQIGLACWRKHQQNGKVWITPTFIYQLCFVWTHKPTTKSYLESLWFILRLWFLRCGLWKIAKQLKRMFFSRYFHLLTFYHNILTTEMVQSKWRSLARTGDGFFNKMGATWGQNIDIKKTGVQNINYKLRKLGAKYKVTSKILISILSM